MAKVKPNPASAQKASVLTKGYVLFGLKIAVIQALVIALVTFWVYSPAIKGDWVWDDTMYLSGNPLLEQPDRIWKAWFQPGSFIEYYPIEQTVQWIQWQLWGNDTFPYHLTNLVLHLANALLLWRLLAKLGVKLAWIGGLIFAVHPMNVESVAWISELKNCLSLAPALLAMSAWIDFEERRKPQDFCLCLACFLISMLCKIIMAPFPFVILLYAWWKRGRIDKVVAGASLTFLLISVALVALTLEAGVSFLHHLREELAVVPIGGPFARVALVGTAASFYFAQVFLVIGQLPVYPQWQVDPPTPLEFLPWLGFGAALGWLWTKRAGWGGHALFGLGFFFINLGPFLGLHGISYMNFTWVMDHILYLPAIGLIGLIAAAFGDLDKHLAARSPLARSAIITLLIALLAFRAHGYAAVFTNDETLWSYTIEQNPGAWLAQDNLGKLFLNRGDSGKAVAYFAAAIAENPDLADLAELHGNLGHALALSGHSEAGIAEMDQALQIDPNYAAAHNNLGIVLAREGKTDEAIAHFIAAVRSNPEDPKAYNNLGNTYAMTGQLDAAADWYVQALKTKPDYAEARYNLGRVRLNQGKVGEAIAEFEEVLKLKPDHVNAHNCLGIALAQLGRTPEAMREFEIVLQLDPANAVASDNLAKLRQGTPGSPK